MDDEGEVSKVCASAGHSGGEIVRVGGDKGVGDNLAVLAGKVTDLAGLWELAVACGSLVIGSQFPTEEG